MYFFRNFYLKLIKKSLSQFYKQNESTLHKDQNYTIATDIALLFFKTG